MITDEDADRIARAQTREQQRIAKQTGKGCSILLLAIVLIVAAIVIYVMLQ